jgi:hypothetical protein
MRCDRCGADDPKAKSHEWVFGRRTNRELRDGRQVDTFSDFQPVSAAVCGECIGLEFRRRRRRALLLAPLSLAAFAFLVVTIVRQEAGEDITLPALVSLVAGLGLGGASLGLAFGDPALIVAEEASRKVAGRGLDHYWTREEFEKQRRSGDAT